MSPFDNYLFSFPVYRTTSEAVKTLSRLGISFSFPLFLSVLEIHRNSSWLPMALEIRSHPEPMYVQLDVVGVWRPDRTPFFRFRPDFWWPTRIYPGSSLSIFFSLSFLFNKTSLEISPFYSHKIPKNTTPFP